MPYIERDRNGVVKGLYINPQPGRADEYLRNDDEEVLAFLSREPVKPKRPATLDERVAEIEKRLGIEWG